MTAVPIAVVDITSINLHKQYKVLNLKVPTIK